MFVWPVARGGSEVPASARDGSRSREGDLYGGIPGEEERREGKGQERKEGWG